ncbi:hypothetical protein P10VF_208 [Rhizobium phage vB_RleM_P10VF]|uniref:Uncharacterized protein n=1 Tax=Rhizobium phage vB_RleM_P10VF TaxID=1527770 RepID=A0A076YQD6_9CAUD|nr:hypothetical protein P10VF_208 [Rhizobium phage vB_RleM_P10VF]AIK68421.1 hypothetical protein P10VF_208 [Rhizobium phage vB_RleM_P10VF]
MTKTSTPHSIENNSYFNIDNCKSYKTEDNLYKAINKLGLTRELDQFLVVCNREGRFTAIFSPQSPRISGGGYIGFYSQYGFMVF